MKLITKFLNENLSYDGHQIQALWALNEQNIKGSSIVSWIGSMEIKPEKVIDIEDQGLEIKASENINFIIEHFDVQPPNIRLCYHRQRILVMILQNILNQYGVSSIREGDDIYVDGRKLTVSIASVSQTSMKIHFGINITSKGTPEDVDTIGLLETGLITHDDLMDIINLIMETYAKEIETIEEDLTKTRAL
jgi:hypothetical protein